jgi:hypothetical protein
MVLIAVAVLLAMWGLYATTQGSEDADPASPATTEVVTATQEANTEPAPAEETSAEAEAEDEGDRADEATTEEEAPEESEAAQPAPRGGAPAVDPEHLHVLNNSTVPNLAADVAGTLDRDGYRLGEVGNLAELILPETTVFFQPGNRDAEQRARELADRVGGVAREYDQSLPEGTEGRNDLTLVLVDQVAL